MENKNEKWEVIEHSWSDTSIVNQDNEIICTLSIYGSDDEDDQEVKEKNVSDRFRLISKAPEMLQMLRDIVEQENVSQSCHDCIYDLIKKATEL